jgi:hypothetical protein
VSTFSCAGETEKKEVVMDYLQQVIRMIELLVMPIKALPFENDYKKGQLDMADTITRLVKVAQNHEGTKNAEEFELREVSNG